MNTRREENSDAAGPAAAGESGYTIEIVAQLAGVSTRTILEYREQGLISPVVESGAAAPRFNDEALRTLRRLEHLRNACGMNVSGLKLVLGLLDEIERLSSELRWRI